MLKVELIVRPERVGGVTVALDESGCTGYHYTNITGQGRQGGIEVFAGRGGRMTKSAVPKTLITTVIPDEMLDKVVEAVLEAARTPGGGNIGDGKIFVSPVVDAIRIRTGEKGAPAV